MVTTKPYSGVLVIICNVIDTPPYPLSLSFLNIVKLGGKTSLFNTEFSNHDSVPMIKSGLCSETK